MPSFEELERLWQEQPGPAGPDACASIAGELRAYARKARRRTVFKTAGVSVVLGLWLLWFFLKHTNSTGAVAGALWMGVSSAIVLVVYWRRQIRLSRLFAEPSLAFLRTAPAVLARERIALRMQLVTLAVSLAAGANLIAASTHKQALDAARVTAHASATAVYFLAFGAGLWFRERRQRRDAEPLMGRLDALRRALEENS